MTLDRKWNKIISDAHTHTHSPSWHDPFVRWEYTLCRVCRCTMRTYGDAKVIVLAIYARSTLIEGFSACSKSFSFAFYNQTRNSTYDVHISHLPIGISYVLCARPQAFVSHEIYTHRSDRQKFNRIFYSHFNLTFFHHSCFIVSNILLTLAAYNGRVSSEPEWRDGEGPGHWQIVYNLFNWISLRLLQINQKKN